MFAYYGRARPRLPWFARAPLDGANHLYQYSTVLGLFRAGTA